MDCQADYYREKGPLVLETTKPKVNHRDVIPEYLKCSLVP